VVSLSTAYAFAEFFGVSGSLDDSFKKSKTFYILFGGQMLVAAMISMFGGISLFQIAVVTQTINAIALPPVFFYLIRLTNDKSLMGEFANNKFQKYFSIGCTIFIVLASISTVAISIYQGVKK
jgi:Mn2+/Fe2+ NRAMP family transporter